MIFPKTLKKIARKQLLYSGDFFVRKFKKIILFFRTYLRKGRILLLHDSRILHDIIKQNRIGDYKSFGKTLLEGIDFVMDFTKF